MRALLLLLAVVCGASALPINSTAPQSPLWMRSGKWQGDIVLTPEQEAALRHNGRNGVTNPYYRWSDRTMKYKLREGDFDEGQAQRIRSALEEYNRRTCLKVREATPSDTEWILVTKEDSGCWSFVGKLGGEQTLNLQENAWGTCIFPNIIVHEFMHAAGFYHEQSATDRDDYVRILWENIDPPYWYAFDKYGSDMISSFGVGYDLKSVMHYENYAFSINGQPTIQALHDPNLALGNNEGFTDKDVRKINAMYGC